MKKVIILFISFFLFSASAYGITPAEENKLLMKAMVEGATTKEQKLAVAKYLQLIAKEKLKQAQSYRRLARSNFGGKAMRQKAKSKEYKRRAQALEREAKNYQRLAGRYLGSLAKND